MKRYQLLFIYSLCGFLFVTIYLMAAIVSKSSLEDTGSRRVLRTTAAERQAETLELTEAEGRRLLRQVEATNNRRIENLEKGCRKYNLGLFKTSEKKILEHPPVPQYGVFYFDRDNRLSFCPIYKAGSSTWLYNLLLLKGMTEEEIESSQQQLSVLGRSRYPELEPSEAEEVAMRCVHGCPFWQQYGMWCLQALQRSIKILTVRHPFERLLSAYRDKLENTNVGREHGTLHFYRSFGSKIVRKYRSGGNGTKTWDVLQPRQYLWNPEQPKPAGIEPTFREFVLYLIKINLAHYADDHWIPYYLFCTPCLVRYDIVAKVETMESDQLYAINVLGLQKKLKPRWRHKTQFVRDNPGDSLPKLSKIYFSQLTTEEIQRLYDKYKVDFDLFDYDHSEYLKCASDYSPNA